MSKQRAITYITQMSVAVLAVTGLITILYFTYYEAYQSGECSDNTCAVSTIMPATVSMTSTASPDASNHTQTPKLSRIVESEIIQDGFGNQPDPWGLGNGRSRRNTTTRSDPAFCEADPPDISQAESARCWLRLGDAYKAVGEFRLAQSAWNNALELGDHPGSAQASLTAHQRLQSMALSQTCPTTRDSLLRIANGYNRTGISGGIITLRLRQNALAALGYYSQEVDGSYGPVTRRAVRDFQADMGFDMTGALNAQETVDLVCHAAVTARDPDAQNLLGIMFATGLGVTLNVDRATEWLEIAATRGHPEANYNLAVVYGTGTLRGSYRLCGLIENPDRADSYLREADMLGHSQANRFRQIGGSPQSRWNRIKDALTPDGASQSSNPDPVNNDILAIQLFDAWQTRLVEEEARIAAGEERNRPRYSQSNVLPGCNLNDTNQNDYSR